MKSSIVGATLRAVTVVAMVMVMAMPGCDWPLNVDDEKGNTSAHKDEDRPPIPDEAPFAEAEVDKLTHNFQVMAVGEKGSHTFTVTNKSKERPLLLKKGPTTCKCTLADLENGELKPGKSMKITLSWKIPEGSERFEQNAEIWTSDPKNPTLVLSISGEIRKTIEILPSTEWKIGAIGESKTKEYTGLISSGIFSKFKILALESTSKNITATHIPLSKDDLTSTRAKSGYRIKLAINPVGLVGILEESLIIKTELPDKKTGGKRLANFAVKIVGSMTGAAMFRPLPGVRWAPGSLVARLGQFNASDGKEVGLRLFITEPEGLSFKITDIVADPPFLKATIKRVGEKNAGAKTGERSQFLLTLSVPPGSPRASRLLKNYGTIKFKTNHPKARTMKIGMEFHSN